MDITAEKNVITNVPVTSGRTPKLGLLNKGVHLVPNRNSRIEIFEKNPTESLSSDTMIPIVVNMVMTANKKEYPWQ